MIESGATKQERLRSSIAKISTAINELEGEIHARRQELAQVEADLNETNAVKERLETAAHWAETAAPQGAGARP